MSFFLGRRSRRLCVGIVYCDSLVYFCTEQRCGRINRCIICTSLFDSVFRLPLLAVPTEQPDDGVADS
ncbi:hypothetical protein AG1IA_08098 [Rhizoctonia solani AG-1 IA]|uniref:Uncharacterized protein n=1 Tax=Thanatephorus cucumeris (strain AG1-IA) TaxID=983506 RepID=L8WI50_THACA|nr:hypothetical protein AG1IA_08098 [Rhizoctonia solani AG-1 IA]